MIWIKLRYMNQSSTDSCYPAAAVKPARGREVVHRKGQMKRRLQLFFPVQF